MKNSTWKPLGLAGIAAVAVVFFNPAASAQNIAWGTANNTTGDSDLTTLATSATSEFDALIPNPLTTSALTVDGVVFDNNNLTGNATSGTDGEISWAWNASASSFENNTAFTAGSANYNTLLNDGGTYQVGGTSAQSATVTLSGLTAGNSYAVWQMDYAGDGAAGNTSFNGSSDVTLLTQVGGNNAIGQWAIGTFTATSSSETYTLNGAGDSYTEFGAIAVFNVAPVPEPSVGGLLGAGFASVCGLAIVRRRRALVA